MITNRASTITLGLAALGAILPILVYAADIFGRTMWGQVIVLALCPSYLMLLGTAACERFDACSMSTLLTVAAVNSFLYGALSAVLWTLKRWSKHVGWALVPLFLLEAFWIKWLVIG
jgi:hypothetical protein